MAHACSPRRLRQEDCHEFQARMGYTGWASNTQKQDRRKKRKKNGWKKKGKKEGSEGGRGKKIHM